LFGQRTATALPGGISRHFVCTVLSTFRSNTTTAAMQPKSSHMVGAECAVQGC
jgi:hypothetical protein